MEFKCSGDNLEQIPEEVISKTGICFPLAHLDKNSMATLSSALRRYRDDVIARVPFCVTVEAEALGAKIKLGNAVAGPRVESYAFSSLEELANLQGLDLTKGRISEVLDAVEIMAESGETVALSVEGPFTIISSLIDPMNFYKGLRNNRQQTLEILAVIEDGITRYSLEAIKRGAQIISYADPVGAMDIVGPKVYREISGPASLRVINRINEAAEKVLIHLCGKISTALEKIEMAKAYPIPVGETCTYGEALIELLNKTDAPVVVGHRCIKWSPKSISQPLLWGIELNKN